MDLPSPDILQISLTIGTGFLLYVAVVKAAIPVWRWSRNAIKSMSGLVAIFLGREPFIDAATGKSVPAVPSLVDALVEIRDVQDEQSRAISDLTSVVTQVADQQITLSEHTRQIADLRMASAIHTEQIGLLKLAASERTETAKAAAAALNLVRDEQTTTAEQAAEEIDLDDDA